MPIEVSDTAIDAVRIVDARRFGDNRGFFRETFNARDFAASGLPNAFVQDNHSRSAERGTVRGLHFQHQPHAQGKLVQCVRGAIFDVAVDLRQGSPTFGQHVSVELSEDNGLQLWVPEGFAHGFCTLEPASEVMYKVTDYYAPEADAGIFWNDPALAIDWPVSEADATLSDKDRQLPLLADIGPVF